MAEDEASSKKIVIQLFGEDLGEKLALAAGSGKMKDYRGVLEPTDPTTQCDRSGHPFEPNMLCYLCGEPIPDKKLLSGPSDELWVECEHILPVTHARWYLDLYMTTRKPSDEWTRKAVELEYAQAHRVCNQAKSNTSFIKEDDTTGNPIVSMNGIRVVLLNISSRAAANESKYNGDLRVIMSKIRQNVTKRQEEIKKIVQPIIDHASSVGDKQLKESRQKDLIMLIRTALLQDDTPMPAPVKEAYFEWKKNQPERVKLAGEKFKFFANETFDTYPTLRPELIANTLKVPERFKNAVTSESVKAGLKLFFENHKGDVPEQKTLLSAIYYSTYATVASEMFRVGVANKSPEEEYACEIYRRMGVIMKNEPTLVGLYQQVPIPDRLKTRCEQIQKIKERETRTQGREIEGKELQEELPTPDEEAAYAVGDIERQLKKQAVALYGTAKVELPRNIDTSLSEIVDAAKESFKDAIPKGAKQARGAAARQSRDLITVTFGNQPEIAAKLSDFATDYIMSHDKDQTRTYGGRRPLYSTTRGKRIKTRRVRRTRRTYRK